MDFEVQENGGGARGWAVAHANKVRGAMSLDAGTAKPVRAIAAP